MRRGLEGAFTVLFVKMCQRSRSREKKKRGDLETSNKCSVKSPSHNILLSQKLETKSSLRNEYCNSDKKKKANPTPPTQITEIEKFVRIRPSWAP